MTHELAAAEVEPYARMALAALHRPYPTQIHHVLRSDQDARAPRELTPAFFGCYDWHSAVHGHWCLVRSLRCCPDLGCGAEARRALGQSLTPGHLATEASYLEVAERRGFERPYGLAWLLQLCAELREWGDAEGLVWLGALGRLEALAVTRLGEWLSRLRWPVRSGEHGQTAFALGLAHDWARAARDPLFARSIQDRSYALYGRDRDAPLAYEPSGHDFLSPILGEADLMRRALAAAEYRAWLESFLRLDGEAAMRWLTPAESPDRSDGKLAHLDGLNLSRAWMLEGVAAALPDDHPFQAALAAAARHHREAGLAGTRSEHYAGSHWLGSFAIYLVTRRGIAGTDPG
jgi:DUF2891 family protein